MILFFIKQFNIANGISVLYENFTTIHYLPFIVLTREPEHNITAFTISYGSGVFPVREDPLSNQCPVTGKEWIMRCSTLNYWKIEKNRSKKKKQKENWKHHVELVSTCRSYVKRSRNLIVNETKPEFWKSRGYRRYSPTGRAPKEGISGSLSYYESIRSHETVPRDNWTESASVTPGVTRSHCWFKDWLKSLHLCHSLLFNTRTIDDRKFGSEKRQYK